MAKQTKKESIEEVVNNEITEVVDKVTTPETEKNEPTPEPESKQPVESEQSEPEQPEPTIEPKPAETGNGTENAETEQPNPESATELESITKSEQPVEPENTKERTELPEGDLPKEIYESLAKCNWFNHLNIGKFLEDKYETTKENLALFFEDYKSGNYLSSHEEYDVFRKLNEYFQ